MIRIHFFRELHVFCKWWLTYVRFRGQLNTIRTWCFVIQPWTIAIRWYDKFRAHAAAATVMRWFCIKTTFVYTRIRQCDGFIFWSVNIDKTTYRLVSYTNDLHFVLRHKKTNNNDAFNIIYIKKIKHKLWHVKNV